jgi:hypothetical protein
MAGRAAARVTVGPGRGIGLDTMRVFIPGERHVTIDMADFVLSGAW